MSLAIGPSGVSPSDPRRAWITSRARASSTDRDSFLGRLSDIAVRLYHLRDDGAASTLLYGTLSEALAEAHRQPGGVQDGLFLQTSDDVVSYLDLIHR